MDEVSQLDSGQTSRLASLKRACGPVPVSGRAAVLRLAAEDAALAGLFDAERGNGLEKRDLAGMFMPSAVTA